MNADYEFKTPAGFVLKIKASRNVCIVFWRDNQPEIAKLPTGDVLEQEIPNVLFVGTAFRMSIKIGEYVIIKSQGGRLRLPYRMNPGDELRYLNISCRSASDRFPVRIQHFESVKQYLSRREARFSYGYLVVDSEIPRLDLVNLKAQMPDARVLVIQKDFVNNQNLTNREAGIPDNMRASEVAGNTKGSEANQNPVFLARIHLRELNFGSVKTLLLDFDLTYDEMQFIKTFVEIMIKNEHNKAELERVRPELEKLSEIYRLASMLNTSEKLKFDGELESGMSQDVAREMVDVVSRRRSRATSREDEILNWEWEYRLKKLAGLEVE